MTRLNDGDLQFGAEYATPALPVPGGGSAFLNNPNIRKELLNRLADLGGRLTAEDDITFEGTRLVIPARMTMDEAIKFLITKKKADEEVNAFTRTYRFRPWDGGRATQSAFRRVFGSVTGKTLKDFFGNDIPPELITINVGPDETEQIPWGALQVPLINGTIHIGATRDPEWGVLFELVVEAPRKYRHEVEGIFRMVEEELRTNSMYKGAAINGKANAEFLDLRGVDPSQVVYAEDVRTQLDANVWSLLRHTGTMQDLGLPLKRSVLLEGPYGTGKTLAAFLTAQLAVENGWTFVYCRPGKDDLDEVMSTARLYQPAVVFFEDMDTVASGGDQDEVTRLLDLFDGITAKGTQLMVILTTNHADRIHKGMVRPGRLDAVIHIGHLDAMGIEEMVRNIVPDALLDPDLDFEAVATAMEGYLPAFVREAIDRTMRYAISRNGGAPQKLITDDFVQAAEGLRSQLALMEGAGEGPTPDPMSKLVERIVTGVIDRTTLNGHSLVVDS